MNLYQNSHSLNVSGCKTKIILTRLQAEKIMLLLLSSNPPKFLKLNDDLINTAFITSIVEEFSLEQSPYQEPAEEEKLIHQQYLKLQENNNVRLIK